MMGQSSINITPNIYTYVLTKYLISMTHEMWSLVYIHNSLGALLLSQFISKLDYRYI